MKQNIYIQAIFNVFGRISQNTDCGLFYTQEINSGEAFELKDKFCDYRYSLCNGDLRPSRN